MSNTNLGETAQLALDVFYQSYTTDEAFLTDVHFRYMIAAYYSTILLNDYNNSKTENVSETGFIYPTFATELLRNTNLLDVKKDGDFSYVEPGAVVSFPYDNYGYGVQSVRCAENLLVNKFNRTNSTIKNKLGVIPFDETIWWWVEGLRIYMYSGSKIPSKVVATIIPAMDWKDETFIIPDTLQTQIVNGVIDFFKQKTSNTVVDMSNNSNPNAVLQTEIDNVSRNLKTKA